MSGPDGTAACEAFIEALGLKTLFSVFMGKVSFASALGPASKHTFKVAQETQIRRNPGIRRYFSRAQYTCVLVFQYRLRYT